MTKTKSENIDKAHADEATHYGTICRNQKAARSVKNPVHTIAVQAQM
jgi:hypothetical protein